MTAAPQNRVAWSPSIPPISEPYQQTVGAFAEQLRAHSGKEESDPAKVARVVRDLAGRPDAPVRIVLGAQAYQLWRPGDRIRQVFGFGVPIKDRRANDRRRERNSPAPMSAA